MSFQFESGNYGPGFAKSAMPLKNRIVDILITILQMNRMLKLLKIEKPGEIMPATN